MGDSQKLLLFRLSTWLVYGRFSETSLLPTCLAALSMFASSASFAWVSPMVPKLKQSDSPIPITGDEGGWIVFAIAIGRIAAIIPSAWAMDRFGRKRTLLVGGLPMLIGWIVCINATSVPMLYVFRALCGLTLGVTHTVVLPMYLGEIGSDAVRGSVSTMHGVMAKSGICFAFAIGPFVSFRLMGWLELLPICMFLLTFVWCPESPYWLLANNQPDAALASLKQLRGHPDVQAEFEKMQAVQLHSVENPIGWRDILVANNRRGLVVTLGLSLGIVFTGTEAILSFAQVPMIDIWYALFIYSHRCNCSFFRSYSKRSIHRGGRVCSAC